MISIYLLLCLVCLLVVSFSSYELKYLALVDESFIEELKLEYKGKLTNKELYENKVIFLEFINVFALSLGLVFSFVLGREIEFVCKLYWSFSVEFVVAIIYGVLLVFISYYLPRAIARRQEIYEDVKLDKKIYLLAYPLYLISRGVKKSLNKKSQEEEKIDEDVLNEMVDSFEEEGVIEEDEANMVRGAIELHNIEAHEIMTPRVDVFAINDEEDIHDLLKNEEIFTHSRIPVYHGTIDHIVGVLPLKSLYRYLLKGETADIMSLCYKPLFVSSSLLITDLLDEFRSTKTHIAVVIDEYGGTKGIVTMEDILEEIVGDIFDETDEIEEEVYEKSNGVYVIDGSMNVDDFFQEIEYEGEYETGFLTVSGFVQELIGRFPKKGDVITFQNYQFKVLSIDGFVVDKLEVKKITDE